MRRPARRHRSQSAEPEVATAELIGYEDSPLRWTYDALLAEYAGLRAEIVLVKEQMERTYVYLLTLLAGVFASQLIFAAGKALDRYPWIYLAAALLALWFPLNNVTMAIDMVTLGTYIREIAAVRINAISLTVGELAAKLHEIPTGVMLGLPTNRRAMSLAEGGLTAGPMNWEEFIGLVRPGRALWQRAVLVPVYVARNAFLYSPSALLIAIFAERVKSVTGYEVILLIMIAVLLVCLLVASFSVGSIVSFNIRYGIHSKR